MAIKKIKTTNYIAPAKDVNRAIQAINAALANVAAYDQSLNKANDAQFNTVITTSNGNINNVKIGDDAYIGDGNVANGIVIKGQQNQNIGLVKFGPNAADPIIGSTGTGRLNISTLASGLPVPDYADNTAATNAGLAVGDIYRTGDILKIRH